MNLTIFSSRCREYKTKVQHLEQEIATSLEIITCIRDQNWEALKSNGKDGSVLLEALFSMGKKLGLYSIQEKDQLWVGDGLAKISKVLQQYQNDIHLLTKNVLNEIIKTSGVSRGAIFVSKERADKEMVLEMTAVYAPDKKRHDSIEVELGDGLVGQCFVGREKIYLTEIPKCYMPIASGLGEATPRCILLAPLRLNNETVGVIELASFTLLTPRQFLFLEKISENITGAIVTVKEAEKTKKLLMQSETMTLELTKREEDLRRTLVEMSAIQEDQLRKQNELEKANKEIQEQKKEIEQIQKRETELIESKLKTQQELADKVITKLKSKVEELQNKIDARETVGRAAVHH